jgi:hypothetical protein
MMSQEEAKSQCFDVATKWLSKNASDKFPVLEIMHMGAVKLYLQIQTQIQENNFAPNMLSIKSQLVWEITIQISSCQEINVPTTMHDINLGLKNGSGPYFGSNLTHGSIRDICQAFQAEWLPVSDRSLPSSCLGMVKDTSFALFFVMFSF